MLSRPTGRRHRRRPVRPRPRMLLAGAALTAVLLPAGTLLTPSGALFVDAAAVADNTVTAGVIQPPGDFAADSAAGTITLTWSPTPSTYADGYKVFRATDSSDGPWTEIATVTGRNTTAWTDDSPASGTNYYTVRSYRVNWLSGTTTVGEGTGVISITDTFAGSGSLGVSETGGATWKPLNGATWSRSGGFATTSAASSSNPMAVVDATTQTVDVTIPTPTASGEAIYFRVVDDDDWLRARARHYTQQRTVYTYSTQYEIADVTSEQYVSGYNVGPWGPYGDGYVCYTSTPVDRYEYGYLVFDVQGRGTDCSARTGVKGSYNYYVQARTVTPIYSYRNVVSGYYWSSSSYAPSPDYWTGSTRQVQSGSYQVTDHYYQVIVEKSVAGAQSTLGSYSLGQSAPSSVRVVANGTTIQTYRNTTVLLGTITDTTHQTATQHGIGLAGPTEGPTNRIDQFTLTGK